MYAYIEGTIEQITEAGIVLDHDGIGYEIGMSSSDLAALSGRREPLRIYTYFQVSENGVSLFGFLDRKEKELFLLLISVNGVGPKAAIAILGTLSVEALTFAILEEDVKSLTAAPGIGAKTAKRILLDLRDKIDAEEAIEAHLDAGGAETGLPSAQNDAREALIALGYSAVDVRGAFSKMTIPEEATAEDLIRAALKEL